MRSMILAILGGALVMLGGFLVKAILEFLHEYTVIKSKIVLNTLLLLDGIICLAVMSQLLKWGRG